MAMSFECSQGTGSLELRATSSMLSNISGKKTVTLNLL